MIDYKTIGNRIRERRIRIGFSQEKLAEMCNVGTTHISHIETGNCIAQNTRRLSGKSNLPGSRPALRNKRKNLATSVLVSF